MIVISPGHTYLLPNFEAGGDDQQLQFIQKEQRGNEFVTVQNGTTNEEVILALIDRINFLDNKASHPQNKAALGFLLDALACLNRRTEERKARGVEGTPAK